jgi:hypothetical protein
VEIPVLRAQTALRPFDTKLYSVAQSLALVNQQGGLPMNLGSHLAELERRHEALEREIEDALHHPSMDTLVVTELNRKKLQLKDEIEKLKDESVH